VFEGWIFVAFHPFLERSLIERTGNFVERRPILDTNCQIVSFKDFSELAVELIKLIKPYQGILNNSSKFSGIEMVTKLISSMAEDSPTLVTRMMALLYGKELGDIVEELKDKSGLEVATILTKGFVVNPIPDLIESGFALGLLDRGWIDA